MLAVWLGFTTGLVALIVFGPALSKMHPAWYVAPLVALPIATTVAHSLVLLRGHRRWERLRQESGFARGDRPGSKAVGTASSPSAEYVSRIRFLGLAQLKKVKAARRKSTRGSEDA